MADYLRISEALDVFSQTPGAILYRGTDRWVALEPGAPGQVLKLDANGFPYWTDAS